MINRIRVVAAAGILALSATASFAQSELKARIPFAFSTPGGGMLPAGEYALTKVNESSPTALYRITSVATGKGVVALAPDTIMRSGDETKFGPELTFRCAGENCAISGVFYRGQRTGYGIPVKLRPAVPATSIAEVRIPMGE